jgi:hypothetical protein
VTPLCQGEARLGISLNNDFESLRIDTLLPHSPADVLYAFVEACDRTCTRQDVRDGGRLTVSPAADIRIFSEWDGPCGAVPNYRHRAYLPDFAVQGTVSSYVTGENQNYPTLVLHSAQAGTVVEVTVNADGRTTTIFFDVSP